MIPFSIIVGFRDQLAATVFCLSIFVFLIPTAEASEILTANLDSPNPRGAKCREALQQNDLHPTQSLWSQNNLALSESALKGAAFLHKLYPQLHLSPPVENNTQQINKSLKQTQTPLISKPAWKIALWLEHLEAIALRMTQSERLKDKIRRYYHRLYVTPINEIPESLFKSIEERKRRLGYGRIKIGRQQRKKIAQTAIEDQKKSLDQWVDYLFFDEAANYPTWAKYWTLSSLSKLGNFDIERGTFGHRSRGQVAPFPELNREAYSLVIDALIKKVQGEDYGHSYEDDFIKLIEGGNFGKLYGYSLKKASSSKIDTSSIEGQWVIFKKGSNPRVLADVLRGQNTGWCTAGENTAKVHLDGGDIHIYFSFNTKGQATVPRIAIRMMDSHIAEIRGVGPNQGLDPIIANTSVLSQKLEEFGDQGKSFGHRSAQMKLLSQIEQKNARGQELTKDELRFLYEIGETISGFGYYKDPRIKEIQKTRDIRADLSLALDLPPRKISLNESEALRGGIAYHFGDLKIRGPISGHELLLPDAISGSLTIENLLSAEGLTLPVQLGGGLRIGGLRTPQGLQLPVTLSGSLDLSDLESAEGLEFPLSIKGSLLLNHLKTLKGFKIPQHIGGGIYLRGLKSAVGLELPKLLDGDLYLPHLLTLEGVVLPEVINGDVDLSSLQNPVHLVLPKKLPGSLFLDGLTTLKGGVLPEHVAGTLSLAGLETTEGAVLPDVVGEILRLSRIPSTDGLKLPRLVGGIIQMESVQSIENLELPANYQGFVIWGVGF